ncbi:MAG: type IX secretion system membrane protein PorP/SprF [Cytophagaceae bacterium]
MRKSILIIAFCLVVSIVHGQQLPQYSQYIWNSYLINPAIGGADNHLEMKAGYRNQWIGLEGAPRTLYFTIHGQKGKKLINREDKDVINRSRSQPPINGFSKAMGYKKRKYPTAPSSFRVKPHHGFGMQIMSDQIGPFNTTGVYGSYAYHIPITREVYASAGAFVGIKQYRIDINKITLTQADDQAVSHYGGDLSGAAPDGMVGVMVYGNRFYAGASMNQIFITSINFTSQYGNYGGAATLTPHYFLMGGYRIKLSSELAVVPSTIVRYLPGTNPAIDVTAKFNYQDILWAGASVRGGDAVVFLVGFSYNNRIDFGYSYDYTTSRLNRFNSGTHEIVVGYRLVNKATSGCKPSYVW